MIERLFKDARIDQLIVPPRVIYPHPDHTKVSRSNGDGLRDRLVSERINSRRPESK